MAFQIGNNDVENKQKEEREVATQHRLAGKELSNKNKCVFLC